MKIKNALLNVRQRPGLLATITAVGALAAVPAVLLGLHNRSEATAPAASAAPSAVPVSVATVVSAEVAGYDEFSGRLEAVDRVELRSRTAGTVQAVHFREGALVKQGDLLFTIDPAPYAADVERAEAQLAAARSRLTHAGNEHERAKRHDRVAQPAHGGEGQRRQRQHGMARDVGLDDRTPEAGPRNGRHVAEQHRRA